MLNLSWYENQRKGYPISYNPEIIFNDMALIENTYAYCDGVYPLIRQNKGINNIDKTIILAIICSIYRSLELFRGTDTDEKIFVLSHCSSVHPKFFAGDCIMAVILVG